MRAQVISSSILILNTNMSSIIEALNWRYATKQFDATKKLTQEQIDTLTEAIRLSASSYGLQPWKFITVTNPAIRQKLREAAWNQSQITDASHVIVFAIRKDINEALVDEFIASVAKTRGLKVEDLKGYSDMIKGSIQGKSADALKDWATRQVYIALGTLLTAAAIEKIDVCPMEGFDSKKFDEILGLEKLGLESRVVGAIGFRSAGDTTAAYKKARYSKEEVFIEVK